MRYLERFGCAAVAAHWSLLMFAPAFCPAAMAFDPVRAAAVTLVGAAFGAHVLVRARFRPFVLVGRPVDIARVVVGDQHRPLRARYSTHTLAHHTVFVDDAFLPRFAVRVGAGIGRIGEYLMNRMIRRRNPADGVAVVQAQRERELLGDEPQPDAAHRPEFGEPLENRANGPGDRFVGMQPDLAVVVATK